MMMCTGRLATLINYLSLSSFVICISPYLRVTNQTNQPIKVRWRYSERAKGRKEDVRPRQRGGLDSGVSETGREC